MRSVLRQQGMVDNAHTRNEYHSTQVQQAPELLDMTARLQQAWQYSVRRMLVLARSRDRGPARAVPRAGDKTATICHSTGRVIKNQIKQLEQAALNVGKGKNTHQNGAYLICIKAKTTLLMQEQQALRTDLRFVRRTKISVAICYKKNILRHNKPLTQVTKLNNHMIRMVFNLQACAPNTA